VNGIVLACALLACAACGGEDTPSPGTHQPEPSVDSAPAPQRTPDAKMPAATPAGAPAERPGMVYIPAGEFLMGRNMKDVDTLPIRKTPEHPQHPVWVDAFYIDKYEVTNQEFEQFQPHQRHKQSPCDDCPVTKVSWHQGREYCASKGKRLPTEAEWEKAAKGGETEEPKPLPLYAWIFGISDNHAHPVGKKRPNGYGLHDMLGNVREWTTDWYDAGYYRQGETRNPKGPAEGKRRVERGGAFFLSPRGTTTTIRYNHPPEFRLYFLGFRCAQDP